MSKTVDLVTRLAEPIVQAAGCELWDVEYVREGGQYYLRVYIDKPEGISINDCENVSRALDPALDKEDPIDESYIFEVSSAGLERQLKKPAHFTRFIGQTVEVKLYKAVDGTKVFSGELEAYEKGDVTIMYRGENMTFQKGQVAAVHISLI